MERESSSVLSSRVNDAYAVLKAPLQRAMYMLTLLGCDAFVEGGIQPAQAPAELLMEMMTVREEIEETTAEESLRGIKEEYEEKAKVLVEQEMEFAFGETGSVELAVNATVKLQYYQRVIQEIQEKLAMAY